MEEWKSIKDYEGLYEVSNMGRVKSLNYRNSGIEKKLKLNKSKQGYLRITLNKNGDRKTFQVHRLVAEAFIPNIDNKPEIDHIDTNKENNCVYNLRWVTGKENMNNELTKNYLSKKHIGLRCGEDNPMYGRYGKNNPTSKKVVQLSLNKELIKIWDSMADVERELRFNKNHISSCCNKKRKTHKGYIWMFYEDYINNK